MPIIMLLWWREVSVDAEATYFSSKVNAKQFLDSADCSTTPLRIRYILSEVADFPTDDSTNKTL